MRASSRWSAYGWFAAACMGLFVPVASCSQGGGHGTQTETVGKTSAALSTGTPWFPVGPLGAIPLLSASGSNTSPGVSVNTTPGQQLNQTGRATSVAVNPQQPFDVYLGAAGGGLWEASNLTISTTASPTPSVNPWLQIFSGPGPIGAVALDPTTCNTTHCTTLWVGTGEAGIRRETFPGNGLYEINFVTTGGEFPVSAYEATQITGSASITPSAIGSIALAGTTSARQVYFTVTAADVASGYDATVFAPPPPAGYGVFLFDQTASTPTITRQNVPPGDSPTLNLPGSVVLSQNGSNSVVLASFYNRGIYRTIVPSGNWCPVNPGAPSVVGCPAPSPALPNVSTNRFDHIAMAAAGSTVYAAFADCSNLWSGNGAGTSAYFCTASLFSSLDQGVSWTAKATGLPAYTNYEHALAISPLSSSEVYFGGYFVDVSTNGGQTFPTLLNNNHPDIHDVFPSPVTWNTSGQVDPSGTLHVVYAADDGGLAITFFDPTGASGINTAVSAVEPPIFEVDRLGVLPCAAGQACSTAVLGGTNDNGTILYNGGRVWQTLSSADVSDVPFLNANNAFVSWYGVGPSLVGTNGFQSLGTQNEILFSPENDEDNTEFSKLVATVDSSAGTPSNVNGHGKVMLPPFIQDSVSKNFYYATDRVYRSPPSGSTLTAISPRLNSTGVACTNGGTAQGTCPNFQFCVAGQCRDYYTDIEKIDAISAIGSNNDQVYVGMYSGGFWKDVGGTFVQVTNVPTQRSCSAAALGIPVPSVEGAALGPTPFDPNALSVANRCAPITSIDVNPFNTSQAYVAVGGFNNPGQHVFLYQNNGSSGSGDTWTPIADGALGSGSDVPASAIRADPSVNQHVFLGTQQGLYEHSSTTSWTLVGTVPQVPVYDIAFDPNLGRAYAGTHGRGVYMTVTNPVVEVFAGWMPPSDCPPNQPCIWDILVYGQGFQPAPVLGGGPTACTINVLTPGGDVCLSGTVDAFSNNAIKVQNNGTIGQTVFNESDGKDVVAVCFNGNCINGMGTTDISACEPNAANPNRTISAIEVLCPNNNAVVVNVPGACPQLQSPPFTTWDPSLTGDPPPSSAPPITSVTLAAALDGMPMETLCSVTIPIMGSDDHDDIIDRARGAFAASASCAAAGVQVTPKEVTIGQSEDTGATDILRLSAPNAIGRAVYLAAISNPSSPGAPGLCQHFQNFPGYATNQLDILNTTFSTGSTGAAGGSITYTETSPLGRCSITVPTTAGETASAIATSILNAYLATYPTDSNPACPYASNPGDLVSTSPFVPLAPGTLNTIASTGFDVCINDTGVGVSVGPNGVPLLDATLNQAALFATGSLRLSDGVQVTEPSGGFALVANAGSGPTAFSPDDAVGSILSVGPVTLGDRNNVPGLIKSEGTVTLGNNDTVGGPIIAEGNVTPPGLSQYEVTFPPTLAPGLTLQPGAQGTLAPGAYQATSVQSRAELKLSTGTYFFASLDVEPQATVLDNDSAGVVVIYLSPSANPILRGQFQSVNGGDPVLRIVYEGTGTMQLNAPFSGTAVAPNGELDMTPGNGAPYRGSFFGNMVFVDANNITVVHLQPN